MYLYINPLLPDIQITLLEKNIPKKTIQIPKGNDFDSFPETSIFEREDLGRYIPPAFDVILHVMGESINVNTYDPAKNLFKYPEVEQILNVQKENYL